MTIRPALAFLIALCACGEAPTRPREREPVELPLVGLFVTGIAMPTYEGSGETVHPDFAATPAWWPKSAAGYLAITPYPNGDATKENPSVFEGAMNRWDVPRGAPNPVRFPGTGYFSDPDALFNADTREMWLYVRQVSGANTIRLLRSADGTTWSEPVTVAEGPEHTIVSPTIVRRSRDQWLMWSVNSGAAGCSARTTRVELRQSTDGFEWSPPRAVEVPSPAAGLTPWHIDVQWIDERQEFWAVFNAKDPFNCGTTAIYIATSADGISWTTQPRPILVAGEVGELADIVYRTTFSFDAATDIVTLWYSGAARRKGALVWRTVMQRVERAALFGRASLMSKARDVGIPSSVPLMNPP